MEKLKLFRTYYGGNKITENFIFKQSYEHSDFSWVKLKEVFENQQRDMMLVIISWIKLFFVFELLSLTLLLTLIGLKNNLIHWSVFFNIFNLIILIILFKRLKKIQWNYKSGSIIINNHI